MSRPEYKAPPEIFYNKEEAVKYARNSHVRQVQERMTRRAVELCLLPETGDCLVLDVGCGSGVSGDVLTELGHVWIGIDLSPDMIDVALEQETEGDMILADIGSPMRFRPGSFDGVVSISTIQWLCNADKKLHEPYRRLLCFFKWLYQAVKKGSRAVFQFYPDTPQQAEMITSAAMRAGFTGGLVVDYPNSTKAKKCYLCLHCGGSAKPIPAAIAQNADYEEATDSAVANSSRDRPSDIPKRTKKAKMGSREWILRKKQRQRRQGYKVRPDTKFTGRKRKDRF